MMLLKVILSKVMSLKVLMLKVMVTSGYFDECMIGSVELLVRRSNYQTVRP